MSKVSDRKFVTAWVDAFNKQQGVNAVASKLNISKIAASNKATILRTKGVELPKMPLGNCQFSVESLNNLIASRINK